MADDARVMPPPLLGMSESEFVRHAQRAAALAIGRWLEEARALDRPVRSLRIEELEGLAVAAVGAYTELRWQRGVEQFQHWYGRAPLLTP